MSDVHIARTMQVAMRMIEEVAKQRAELQADRKQIQADRKQKEKDAKDASSAIAMNTFCGVHRHLSLVRVPRPRVSDYGHGQLAFAHGAFHLTISSAFPSVRVFLNRTSARAQRLRLRLRLRNQL